VEEACEGNEVRKKKRELKEESGEKEEEVAEGKGHCLFFVLFRVRERERREEKERYSRRSNDAAAKQMMSRIGRGTHIS